jgi:hypothetical protein
MALSGTPAIRMAAIVINAKRLIPGVYITLVLKDSWIELLMLFVYGHRRNFILYFQNGRIVEIGTSYSGVFNVSSPRMYYDGTYSTPSDTAPLRILNPTLGSSIGIVIILVAGLGVLFSLVTMAIVVIHRFTGMHRSSKLRGKDACLDLQ